jgi:adenosylhomocysteinase
VLANAGHFDNEIHIPALEQEATRTQTVRAGVVAYTMRDGRTIHLLTEGRLVNLAAGQGHPVEIMDLSFAVQALGMEHLVRTHAQLGPGVHEVPVEVDLEIARLKLASLGTGIDELTQEQRDYLGSWEHGT